ncbi:nucleotidyltransferase domain-containing protein [Sanguibacter massiliensis]|uniref:nucleotidyltransferase domain-containing protein n=1 Tax=Sanguibacter massiliensis TaxID=1973217 RepID=UPI001A9233F5|nr:nucleotidyltransferase [Sanguibacter massiliensis]
MPGKRHTGRVSYHKGRLGVGPERSIMPTTLESAFSEFDESLNLDAFERRRAQDRHRELRDVLEATDWVAGSFLQGSFARKTMLKPLTDIDIVILLDVEAHPELRGPDGPERAMNLFRAAVKDHWPGAQFDIGDPPAGKALRVHFDDVHFTVDLVPGIDAPGRRVLIGDRFDREWTDSNTRIQIDRVTERNKRCNSKFVHQVRMLKSFRGTQPELDFVSGIVMESLAFQVIHEPMLHAEALAAVLEAAPSLLRGKLLEPAGEDDITEKWSEHERDIAIAVFTRRAVQAREAQELAAAGDPHSSIDVWHDILGDPFPAAPPRSPKDVVTALASGSFTSTQRPSSTLAGVIPGRPTRAWRSN